MQLNPGENFVITHQIGDHTDSGTYYVRAVVRNARTDALIDTVDLINRGSLRFSRSWQVPEDPSGQGFYISITTTVYTDSNYTAKSALYSEEQERLLVQLRVNAITGGGGGGGGGGDSVEVNYKKIRKIVNEEISKIVFPAFPSIKIPNPEKLDLSPVLRDIVALNARIQSVGDAIAALPRFEKTEINFSDVMERFDAINTTFESLKKYMEDRDSESDSKLDGNAKTVMEAFEKKIDSFVQEVQNMSKTVQNMEGKTVKLDLSAFKNEKKEEKPEKKETSKVDVESITRRMQIRKALRS